VRFQLAIYDSTQYAHNSFWCFRESSISLAHLERFYRLLVLNQDIASLDVISKVSPRTGLGFLSQDIGVSYRIFPGQESSRLSSVVIALFFDLSTWRDFDVTSVWNQIQEIEQYITQHQRENGILSCPLRNPSKLVFETELPCLPLSDHSQNLTPYSLQDTKLPDFRSARFISNAPSETLLNTLQAYAQQAGELVCSAHFKSDNQAEIHALWLPTPKHESSVSDMLPSQTEISSSTPKQIIRRYSGKKLVLITLTVIIFAGSLFLIDSLRKKLVRTPRSNTTRQVPLENSHPVPLPVARTNAATPNAISNSAATIINQPIHAVQSIHGQPPTNTNIVSPMPSDR